MKKLRDTSALMLSKVRETSNFCIYCGMHLEEWEKVIDHFRPIATDGFKAEVKSNMFVSCRECNSIKHDMIFESLEEARGYILMYFRMNLTTLLSHL